MIYAGLCPNYEWSVSLSPSLSDGLLVLRAVGRLVPVDRRPGFFYGEKSRALGCTQLVVQGQCLLQPLDLAAGDGNAAPFVDPAIAMLAGEPVDRLGQQIAGSQGVVTSARHEQRRRQKAATKGNDGDGDVGEHVQFYLTPGAIDGNPGIVDTAYSRSS